MFEMVPPEDPVTMPCWTFSCFSKKAEIEMRSFGDDAEKTLSGGVAALKPQCHQHTDRKRLHSGSSPSKPTSFGEQDDETPIRSQRRRYADVHEINKSFARICIR